MSLEHPSKFDMYVLCSSLAPSASELATQNQAKVCYHEGRLVSSYFIISERS